MDSRYEESRKRFESDTAEHAMSVLHDDGLYRHIRYKAPSTIVYYYDLVTWPGHLVICGDAGDYHFSRIEDMFKFFDGNGINPQYWAEKIAGAQPTTIFSAEEYERRVREWLNDTIETIKIDCGIEEIDESGYPDEDRQIVLSQIEHRVEALKLAVDCKLLDGSVSHPDDAYHRLTTFEEGGYYIRDAWEWMLTSFHPRFLWCCWAIVRGSRQYRTLVAV